MKYYLSENLRIGATADFVEETYMDNKIVVNQFKNPLNLLSGLNEDFSQNKSFRSLSKEKLECILSNKTIEINLLCSRQVLIDRQTD